MSLNRRIDALNRALRAQGRHNGARFVNWPTFRAEIAASIEAIEAGREQPIRSQDDDQPTAALRAELAERLNRIRDTQL